MLPELEIKSELDEWKITTSNNHIEQQMPEKANQMDDLEPKHFTCYVCDSKFPKKPELVKHLVRYTGEKPFACKICNYKFERHYDLGRHLKRHTGARQKK